MPMFMVSGGMGQFAVNAASNHAARSYGRRTYGTACEPYTVRLATPAMLADHLGAGAVFFNEDGTRMDPFEAYPLAGLPVPAKFARAS